MQKPDIVSDREFVDFLIGHITYPCFTPAQAYVHIRAAKQKLPSINNPLAKSDLEDAIRRSEVFLDSFYGSTNSKNNPKPIL